MSWPEASGGPMFTSGERDVLQRLTDVMRLLHGRNMLAAADGNISYRFHDDRIAMSPSGRHKSRLQPDDYTLLRLDGSVLFGQPSSERQVHLAIYASQPLARCVVHAHPPVAVALTLAKPRLQAFPLDLLPEVILGVGEIPIVPFLPPGTGELAAAVQKAAARTRAMVLARHGAVSWGEDDEEALNGMERIEHAAVVLHHAWTLGWPQPMEPRALSAVRARRSQSSGRTL